MEWIKKGMEMHVEWQQNEFCQAFPVRFLLISTVLYLYNKVAFLKTIMELKYFYLFICRGLFWTFAEEESHRFSIQYHEQPNVLGINNELHGVLIKVKVSFFLRQFYPFLKVSGHSSTNGTNQGHRKNTICLIDRH